jgi:NADPH:quinone reductase-like Zn-dependent oxidoreductase
MSKSPYFLREYRSIKIQVAVCDIDLVGSLESWAPIDLRKGTRFNTNGSELQRKVCVMQKIVIHGPGGYEKLSLETFPDPVVKPGHLLIRTSAVGVNYADVCVRWGVYESAKRFVGWPITPGFEFSGTVEKLGEGTSRFSVGDSVFGVSLFNSYATHVVADERLLWHRPKVLTLEEAAGFPAVFLTAYHGLFQNVWLGPGFKVLIHSAAGGVGSALVQLAKVAGLKVAGVVGSAHKIDYVKSLGVDIVIDKSEEDLWHKAKIFAPDGYDLVFDANGPETLKASYASLRPTGKLLVYGFHTLLPKTGGHLNYLKAGLGLLRIPKFNPLEMTTVNKGVLAFNLSFLFDRFDLLGPAMEQLILWLDEGKIVAPKVTTFPFHDVAKAHQALESGQSVGKLVLTT